jgi:hypothetical protein
MIGFVAYFRNRRMRWNMTDTGLSRTGINVYTRSLQLILFFLFAGFTIPPYAAELDCPLGDAVMADLGNDVIMHTCMWEKAANVTVRTGPLELIKNGILILKLTTDSNGKLHGQFTSWNDVGEMTENGNYLKGLKEGIWTVTNKNGDSETLHYRAGVIVEP